MFVCLERTSSNGDNDAHKTISTGQFSGYNGALDTLHDSDWAPAARLSMLT